MSRKFVKNKHSLWFVKISILFSGKVITKVNNLISKFLNKITILIYLKYRANTLFVTLKY